jgi:hypothetical protein
VFKGGSLLPALAAASETLLPSSHDLSPRVAAGAAPSQYAVAVVPHALQLRGAMRANPVWRYVRRWGLPGPYRGTAA